VARPALSEAPADLTERLDGWRALLDRAWGPAEPPRRRTPVGQLVKSLISSRTRDPVSEAAYAALNRRFGRAGAIADADPTEVEAVIAEVTFADVKARRLVEALRAIRAAQPDLDLSFLRDLPLPEAIAWLEALPGVGRKTAAAVLNFTALDRPVLAADSHVARVLARLGVDAGDAVAASERVTAAASAWTAADFRSLHVHLKRLGQTLCCRDGPRCEACPLRAACPTGSGAVPGWAGKLVAPMG
jgi:endonuclease-3